MISCTRILEEDPPPFHLKDSALVQLPCPIKLRHLSISVVVSSAGRSRTGHRRNDKSEDHPRVNDVVRRAQQNENLDPGDS